MKTLGVKEGAVRKKENLTFLKSFHTGKHPRALERRLGKNKGGDGGDQPWEGFSLPWGEQDGEPHTENIFSNVQIQS